MTRYKTQIQTDQVVRHRRGPDQLPPRGQVTGLGRPGTSHVEEDSEAVQEERPSGPVGERHVRGQKSGARDPEYLKNTRVGRVVSVAPRGGEYSDGMWNGRRYKQELEQF